MVSQLGHGISLYRLPFSNTPRYMDEANEVVSLSFQLQTRMISWSHVRGGILLSVKNVIVVVLWATLNADHTRYASQETYHSNWFQFHSK